MKLANFVTKLQNVLRPNEEETAIHAVRKGKRLMIPAKDVERLHQYQRKRVVRVMYTGPTKITCRNCGTPFYLSLMAKAAIRNITLMPASKKHIGRERK